MNQRKHYRNHILGLHYRVTTRLQLPLFRLQQKNSVTPILDISKINGKVTNLLLSVHGEQQTLKL